MVDGGEGPGDDDVEDPGILFARLRGKRIGYAIVLVVSVAFIVSSAAQIISAVFGFGLAPLPSGAPEGSPEHACAIGI